MNPSFFANLSRILGGDLNVSDPSMDRSKNTNTGSLSTWALSNVATNYALVDIWRVHHPDLKQFTFFAARHQTYNTLELIISSHQLRLLNWYGQQKLSICPCLSIMQCFLVLLEMKMHFNTLLGITTAPILEYGHLMTFK